MCSPGYCNHLTDVINVFVILSVISFLRLGPMSPGRGGPANMSNSNVNPPQPIHLHRQPTHPTNLVPVSMSMGPLIPTGQEGFQKGIRGRGSVGIPKKDS